MQRKGIGEVEPKYPELQGLFPAVNIFVSLLRMATDQLERAKQLFLWLQSKQVHIRIQFIVMSIEMLNE